MAITSEKIEGSVISVDIVSSNIKGASFNTQTSILIITFNYGGIYEYAGVPWELFTKFRMSESQGAFFNAHIKTKYTHKKLN